jgi:hypothetical protein
VSYGQNVTTNKEPSALIRWERGNPIIIRPWGQKKFHAKAQREFHAKPPRCKVRKGGYASCISLRFFAALREITRPLCWDCTQISLYYLCYNGHQLYWKGDFHF